MFLRDLRTSSYAGTIVALQLHKGGFVTISSFQNLFTRLHLSTVTHFLGMVLRLCSVSDPCQTSIFATHKLSLSVAHYTVIGAETLSSFSSIEK
jgi:hypothetical protein